MPKNPTFEMKFKDGSSIEVPYSPLMFIAGSQTHKLALSKNRLGAWVVSDPKCGAKIVTVQGTYKGVPCSSKGFSLKLARQCAIADLEELAGRIGSDKFNAVMANPQPF